MFLELPNLIMTCTLNVNLVGYGKIPISFCSLLVLVKCKLFHCLIYEFGTGVTWCLNCELNPAVQLNPN